MNYVVHQANDYCTTGRKIINEAECKQAAKELGLTYGKACNHKDCNWIRPGGCFHNDGKNIEGENPICPRGKTCVYFNKDITSNGWGPDDSGKFHARNNPTICRAGKKQGNHVLLTFRIHIY